MSSSEGDEFEHWVRERFAETHGFTALILLLSIGNETVEPVSCSFVHVVGDEVSWTDMKAMLDSSRAKWDGVAMFAETASGGGPVVEVVARARLQERIDEITYDRMALNGAGFFDVKGRAIRIDPLEARQ